MAPMAAQVVPHEPETALTGRAEEVEHEVLGQGQAAEVHRHGRGGLGGHGGEIVDALGLVRDERLGAQRVDLRHGADERRLADAEAACDDDLRRRGRALCLSSFEVHGGSFR